MNRAAQSRRAAGPRVEVRALAGGAAASRRDLKRFVELAYKLNEGDPNWVPPLKSEVYELLNPAKNPFFEHAEMQLFLAARDGEPVGRISAHIDRLALEQPAEQGMGPGTGNWGMFEAADEEAARALLDAAEDWLRQQGMNRALGPLSLSIWDEPGLLTKGHDHPPTIMMGHHNPAYEGWIEGAGHRPAKRLATYELDVSQEFPPLVRRIVASGKRNPRINVRRVDKSRFDEEARTILGILNDAWSGNWGFVPLTDREVSYFGKKLKPIVFEYLVLIAEYDDRPVAFMITLPDVNEVLRSLDGRLLPFGWLKLARWIREPRSRTGRVPLMGVRRELQSSRLASQLAFMMISDIRREGHARLGFERGEIGWILEDNQGMKAIADTIESRVNRVYTIYEKGL